MDAEAAIPWSSLAKLLTENMPLPSKAPCVRHFSKAFHDYETPFFLADLNISVDCSFDRGDCDWKQDIKDDFDWNPADRNNGI